MSDTPMRILHVASFQGNIGGKLNHSGFRPWFEGIASRPVSWTGFEIRDVYRGRHAFDSAFRTLANLHDAVVFSGGNYFELWPDGSATGTSLDIPFDTISEIEVPLFFNALGVDIGQGYGIGSRERFLSFIEELLGRSNVLSSIRNDGSRSNLVASIGSDFGIACIPDHGFFAEGLKSSSRDNSIAINVACDMPEIRFGGTSVDSFAREFAGALVELDRIGPERLFRFVPHVYSDLAIIARVMNFLPDDFRRGRVEVVAYGDSESCYSGACDAYVRADLALAMRFHANVLPISLGIPSIGLVNYPQLGYLFEELKLKDLSVDVSYQGFSDRLISIVIGATDGHAVADRISGVCGELARQRTSFEPSLRDWLRGVTS